MHAFVTIKTKYTTHIGVYARNTLLTPNFFQPNSERFIVVIGDQLFDIQTHIFISTEIRLLSKTKIASIFERVLHNRFRSFGRRTVASRRWGSLTIPVHRFPSVEMVATTALSFTTLVRLIVRSDVYVHFVPGKHGPFTKTFTAVGDIRPGPISQNERINGPVNIISSVCLNAGWQKNRCSVRQITHDSHHVICVDFYIIRFYGSDEYPKSIRRKRR